jgi:predicted Rossmann fold nucleotide-binding protein DprA/Smf involved in DNA uptake
MNLLAQLQAIPPSTPKRPAAPPRVVAMLNVLGDSTMSTNELRDTLRVTPGAIGGTIAEAKRLGLICQVGTRRTEARFGQCVKLWRRSDA